jgi:threonine dehydratase
LSDATGNRILLKREDLQPVFSFKLRGAHNKVMLLLEHTHNMTWYTQYYTRR